MRLSAVLFDFDGTLIDSDPVHLVAFNEVLAPAGIQVTEERYHHEIIGRSNNEIFAGLIPSASTREVIDLGHRKEAAYLRLSDRVRLKDGAREVLRRLAADGVKLALVTNAPRDVVDDIGGRLDLLKFFDAIVTINDVQEGKPSPAPYRHALEQLGVQPGEAIAVEDSPTGRRSAEAAGLEVLLLADGPVRAPGTISSLHAVLGRLEPARQVV